MADEEIELYKNFKQNLDIGKINKEIDDLSNHPLFMSD